MKSRHKKSQFSSSEIFHTLLKYCCILKKCSYGYWILARVLIKNKTPVFSFLWNVNKWWLWRAWKTNCKSKGTAKNISSKLIIFITYNLIFHFYSLIPTQTCYLNKLWSIVTNVWVADFMVITDKIFSWITSKPKRNILVQNFLQECKPSTWFSFSKEIIFWWKIQTWSSNSETSRLYLSSSSFVVVVYLHNFTIANDYEQSYD